MIIWKGLGILSIIIPLALSIILNSIFGPKSGIGNFGIIIGGIVVWFLGGMLNKDNKRVSVDKETGKEVIYISEHSMFWIKMEVWGLIFILFGIAFGLSRMTDGRSETYILPLIGVLIAGYILSSMYTSLKNHRILRDRSDKVIMPPSQENIINSTLKRKPTHQSNKYPSVGNQKPAQQKLTEQENRNKQYYERLRKNRDEPLRFEPSDPSKYMPKNLTSE